MRYIMVVLLTLCACDDSVNLLPINDYSGTTDDSDDGGLDGDYDPSVPDDGDTQDDGGTGGDYDVTDTGDDDSDVTTDEDTGDGDNDTVDDGDSDYEVPVEAYDTLTCPDNKTLLCHNPSGYNKPRQEICVSSNSVSMHIEQHSDSIGECPDE